MRKKRWMEMGVVVLGLLLVGGAVQGAAQTPEAGAVGQAPAQERQQTEARAQAMGVEAQQWRAIAQLRTQVSQLQQQLAAMQARLEAAEANRQGVGGAGTAQQGTEEFGVNLGGPGDEGFGVNLGGPGDEGFGVNLGDEETGQPGVGGGGEPSTAVANIIYEGRVRSVSQRQLVLEEETGAVTAYPLAREVRVLGGNGRRLSIRALEEGTRVRATADMLTRGTPVTRIEVLPVPGREEE